MTHSKGTILRSITISEALVAREDIYPHTEYCVFEGVDSGLNYFLDVNQLARVN